MRNHARHAYRCKPLKKSRQQHICCPLSTSKPSIRQMRWWCWMIPMWHWRIRTIRLSPPVERSARATRDLSQVILLGFLHAVTYITTMKTATPRWPPVRLPCRRWEAYLIVLQCCRCEAYLIILKLNDPIIEPCRRWEAYLLVLQSWRCEAYFIILKPNDPIIEQAVLYLLQHHLVVLYQLVNKQHGFDEWKGKCGACGISPTIPFADIATDCPK